MLRAVLAVICLATPAAAQDVVFFRSPTGNIACMIATGAWAEARCDLAQLTMSFPKRPRDCDLEWGSTFIVGPTGRGTPACVGDTVRDPSAFTLDYGRQISLGGLTCWSEPTGMTCRNGEGHGFTVSRAAQTVF